MAPPRDEPTATGNTQRVGRRGILAVAALAVGLLAKNAADAPRVAAITGGGDQGFLALGSNPWYVAGTNAVNTAAISSAPTVVQASGNFGNFLGTNGGRPVVFRADASPAVGGSINGIEGVGSGSGSGVFGTSSNGNGVFGTYGTGAPAYTYGGGVVGTAPDNGQGVSGICNGSGGYGVIGVSDSGYGMYGLTASGTGVYGSSTSGTGVYGSSTSGSGVYGTAGTGGYGVQGRATGTSGAALYGSSTNPNVPAFYAVNYAAPTPPNSIAGYFIGEVYINGPLVIAGGPKSAAVPHPDGSHRLLYCVESPESWFEDFGEGTISGGKAEVKLDPDFAAVVDTSKLHVFCMSHNASHHLAVTTRAGGSFSVEADVSGTAAARGVKASDVNGTFTYRVVAKRKDVKAERLAKFEMPKAPPALATLPKATPEKT